MIDDALRRFRTYLPDAGPGDTDARALARRVIDQEHTTPASRRGRRRGLAVATATGLAAVGALAVVATRVDRRSGAAAPVVIGQPRVDWGMRALISVTPDPGVSVEDATQRAKELLAERLAQLDVKGAQLRPTKPGQLSLTVPGAEDPMQISWIMQINHLKVFRTTGRVLTGRTLAELRRSLRAPMQGARVKYLVEVERRRAPSPSDIRLVDTVDEAQRLARRLPAESSFVAVDAASALVLSEPGRYSLLPSARTVPSDRLDLTTTASGLVVSYPRSVGGPGRVYVASSQFGIGTGTDRQWVAAGPLRPTRSSADPTRIHVVVPQPGAQRLLLETTTTDPTPRDDRLLIGDAAITSLARYGSPPIEGVPDQSAARTLSSFVNGRTPADAAWRRVLTDTSDGVSVRLFTASKAGPKSLAAAAFTVSRGRRTLSTGSLGMSGTSQTPCPVGIGAPAMNPCSILPPVPMQPGVIAGGRIQPEVARIEARTASGHRFSAIIEGSWFVVVADEQLPMSDFQSAVRLTAFARDGTVLRQTGS